MDTPSPRLSLAEMFADNDDARGALARRMGIIVTEASPERVVATMPVEGNTQPYGMLHGGASCVLAETAGSVGAVMHAQEQYGGLAVGVDINATHHRAMRSGTVTAVATAIQLGGSIAVYDVVISDERNRRVCTARITCAIRRRAPWNMANGRPAGDSRTGGTDESAPTESSAADGATSANAAPGADKPDAWAGSD